MPSRIEKTGSFIEVDAAPHTGDFTVYGQTRQNLWTNPATKTVSGVALTANADGTITISGTATANLWIFITVYNLKPSTSYVLKVDKALQNESEATAGFYVEEYNDENESLSYFILPGKDSISFTTRDSVQKANCAFLAYTGAVLSGTYRVMLNEGGEAEPWCPPGLNSVEELSIVTAGKNLLTSDVREITTENGGGLYLYQGARIVNEDVTISFDGENMLPTYDTGAALFTFYDSITRTSTYITASVLGFVRNETKSGHFEYTLQGVTYDRMNINLYAATYSRWDESSVVRDVQLERGSTATDYEHPTIATTEIDLQGNALCSLPDGTRDELRADEAGAVTLVQRVGYVASYTNQMLGDDIIASAYDKYGLPAQGATVIWRLATEQEIDLGTIDPVKLRKGYNAIFCSTDSVITPEMSLSYFKREINGDGISIGSVHSYYDLGQCIASRNTGSPEKKAITKTVPFMSGFYDFSNLYGGIAYESREISYSFDLLGDSREDLQRQKSELMEWLSYVHDTEIRDDDIPGWHFISSFSGYSWDETADGESGTLEVTFLCQPFMEADDETSKALAIGTHTVTNDGQPVNPMVSVASGTAKITINGFVQSVTGETRLSVQLPHGDTSVKVEGAAATLKWKEARI